MSEPKKNRDWQVFSVDELMTKVAGSEAKIHEFLRVPTLSVSIYHLPAGSRDMQAPHLEDEVYFVIEGKARLKIEDKVNDIRPGNILYVRATANHSFFDIEEDLTVFAVFGG